MGRRLCVRLLSGSIVYEGLCPDSLLELRNEVAAIMGLDCKNELVFCSGDAIVADIKDADEQITVVRDRVMGLLSEFLTIIDRRGELPEHLEPAREHKQLLLAAVKRNGDGGALLYASPTLRADRAFMLAAIALEGRALEHASPELRADRDVVLAALGGLGFGGELQYASPELRADRDIVLAALAYDGRALEHASCKLRADRDIVLAALARDNCASVLKHASAELRADRDLVLATVASDGLALRHASPELRADRDIVLAALSKNGSALQYASPELRADRGVVLAALSRYGPALQHASTELQADLNIVLAALSNNGYALHHASRELRLSLGGREDASAPLEIVLEALRGREDAPVDRILTDSIISVERYLKTHYRQKTSKALI